ncbi:hypothetical protein [Bacteroides ndongoniae]|jgi:hypothetical protein|uniref:hypothetical protein n=1 Tax=Bacteroides ndongoniae TaxID=1903262 RepID=UPI0023F8481F|nr:hypothetical protein [Bacteroides ndongoniae]
MIENLQFIKLFEKNNSVAYNILIGNKEIGRIEGYVIKGGFYSVIHIDNSYQKKGIGFNAFQKVFNELNDSNTISRIVGSWHSDKEFAYCDEGKSTNLRVYLKNIEDGMTNEDSALNTPTGRWARKLGFNYCTVERNNTDSVLVSFIKQKPET